MIPGETIAIGASNECSECKEKLENKVLRSAAGYYIGTWCDRCGPYSRESGYYPNSDLAQQALDSGDFGR